MITAVTHSVLLVMLVALNHGIPYAFRRAVSLEPALLSAAWRRLLTLHLPLAVGAAVLVAAGAPWAARLFGAPLLTAPLQVIAADVALRAGMVEPGQLPLNGAGRHRLQASLMATHSLCRCAAVAGVLALGYGLIGAAVRTAVARGEAVRKLGQAPSRRTVIPRIWRFPLGASPIFHSLGVGDFPLCRYGEDIAFSHAVLQTGARVAYVLSLRVLHNEQRSLAEVFREAWRKGYARVRLGSAKK